MSNVNALLLPAIKDRNDGAGDRTFHETIRPTDLFICSYPKSGTTWIGYLLAQLLKQDADEQLGLDSFNRYVPDVNLIYARRAPLADFASLSSPRFFLCHAAYDAMLPNVVYVLRDPRDVLVSYYHYNRFLNKKFDLTLADYLRADNRWPCDWNEHVESWLTPKRHPRMIVVRYEDLHTDTAGAIHRILTLAGITVVASRIQAAIDAARFDRMRLVEEKFGVSNKAGDPVERFVRKGKVGSWREEMGPKEREIFERRYGRLMREVGYC